MLIIPADRGIDWRRAPVMTATIIALCCLVFFAWQWQDDKRLTKAVGFYMDQSLLKLEYPVYTSYLSQKLETARLKAVQASWQKKRYRDVAAYIVTDHGFTRDIDGYGVDFWGNDVYRHWREARTELNAQLDALSDIHLGLIPVERRPLTFITYQFLHGSTFHLVGNMVVLAVAAVGVEAAIGSFNFLICYLLCGICAGLLYTLVNLSSPLPLVGASGAISGVLGMYAVLYGMRRIRFFYSVIFYFGYFTAPALVILPVWIAWEVINAIWGHMAEIAYWAHAGGLISGGLLMFAGRQYLMQVEETYLDTSPDEDEQYRKALDDFLKQLAAFNFDAARRKLTDLEASYGERPALLEHRYYLEKLRPTSEQYHHCALDLLGRPATDPVFIHLLLDIYRDYIAQDGLSHIDNDLLLKLMLNFSQIEAWDTLREMMKEAGQRKLQHPMLVKTLRILARGLSGLGDRSLSERYQSLANSMELDLKGVQPSL